MPCSIFRLMLISMILFGCVTNPMYEDIADTNIPTNLIAMYGHPEIEKTDAQRAADTKFIQDVGANFGSRNKGAIEIAAAGWRERKNGKLDNAMRRFNQSWLLDPNYYQSYWGFGVISLAKKNPSEATRHFEKALELIDEPTEKHRLLVDAARPYVWRGHVAKSTSLVESERLLNKSISLIDEALKLDPKYESAYHLGAQAYRSLGNYKEAWGMVKQARVVADYNFNPKFLEELSKEMPEPK